MSDITFEQLNLYPFCNSSINLCDKWKYKNDFDKIYSSDQIPNLNLFKEESDYFDSSKLYYIDKTTLTNTNNSDKIFNITKENKKGRKKLINKNRNDEKGNKTCHLKSQEDNIMQKIKVIFTKSSMNFLNKRYEEYRIKKGKMKEKFLMKIKPSVGITIKKEGNIRFLNTKIKDLFSSDLSDKCCKFNKDYNKKKIEELYEKNEAITVIEIMEKTVEELMENYVNGDYSNEGFDINIDLNREKEKMEKNGENDIDEYIEKFKISAGQFRKIFERKIARNKTD